MSEENTTVADEMFALTDDNAADGYATPTEIATETEKPKKAPKTKKTPKVTTPKAEKPAKAPKVKKEKKAPKAKAEPKPAKVKDPKELRRPQLRALQALSDAGSTTSAGIGGAIGLDDIAKRAKVSPAMIRQGLGPVDPAKRDEHDGAWGYRSLISRGMVKVMGSEEGNVYHLTALGEQTIEKKAEVVNGVKKLPVNKSGQKPTKVKPTKKKRRVKIEAVK